MVNKEVVRAVYICGKEVARAVVVAVDNYGNGLWQGLYIAVVKRWQGLYISVVKRWQGL